MNSHLVQFRNRKNLSEKTEKVQIDDNTDISTLSTILNSLLSTNSTYFFYFQNQRITSDLLSIIDKYNLSNEDVIEIDYIDEDSFHSDSFKECSDVVIDISYFDGKIYYLTFTGEVFEFNSAEPLTNNRKGIFSKYAFDDYSLYSIEGNTIIHTFTEKIICGYSIDQTIVVATEENIFLGNLGNFVSIRKHNSFVRALKMNDKNIYWLEEYNKIFTYDFDNQETSVIKTEYSLNDLAISGSKVFVTTANNKILEVHLNSIREYDIKPRLSNYILTLNNSILYTTQNEIITCSSEFDEKNYHRVKGQINTIETDGKNIYVANDNVISVFKKSSLQM